MGQRKVLYKPPVPCDELPTHNPWEKLTEESEPAYAAFTCYLEQGPGRLMNEAYRIRAGMDERPVKAPSGWYRWVVRWRWKERVEAYEISQRAALKQAELEGRSGIHRKRVKSLEAILGVGLRAVQRANEALTRVDADGNSLPVRSTDIALLKTATYAVVTAVEQLRIEFDEEPAQKVKTLGIQGFVDMTPRSQKDIEKLDAKSLVNLWNQIGS